MMSFTVWLCFLFVIYTNAQPQYGLHDEVPIDIDCLAFTHRQNKVLPILLEAQNLGPLGRSQLARHHIIPASTFSKFFNVAVSAPVDHNNVVIAAIMNLMGHLANTTLHLYPENGENAVINRYTRNRLQEMSTVQRLYVNENRNPPLTVFLSNEWLVQTMFQWIPGNIFIGPQPAMRSDDPGNAFEENARYIIGEEDFTVLRNLNNLMNFFISQPYAENTEINAQGQEVNVTVVNYSSFNEAMNVLFDFSTSRNEPYPYDANQWNQDTRTGKYSIRTERHPRIELRLVSSITDYDPWCLRPLMAITKNIKDYNLFTVAKAVDRMQKEPGFENQDYQSWKEYYERVSWSDIYKNGINMLGLNSYCAVHTGYTFRDRSFAVGINGRHAEGENDNWVYLSDVNFRDIHDPKIYAGQVFFDQNSRPVAIVITSEHLASRNSGYSFIYVNGKWEYESSNDWDTKRFTAENTLSLDWHAPRFVIDLE